MDGSGTADRVDPLTVTQRLQREGRWKDIELERNEMMKLARKRYKTKEERQHWVYFELDRLYPPKPAEEPTETSEHGSIQNRKISGRLPMYAESEGGAIKWLGTIPETWPLLTSNASLSAEVGWCQANRLRVIEEQASGQTVVHLGRALSPAPSWAALGWLETSIRSYAKYVDVAARASSTDDGESAVWRRERMAIEEVRELLDEMRADGSACPACGKPT